MGYEDRDERLDTSAPLKGGAMGLSFKITYAHTDDTWLASIYTVPGCHAEGATQEEARERVQQALRYFYDDKDVEFVEEPQKH